MTAHSVEQDRAYIRERFSGEPTREADILWAIRYVGGRMDDLVLWRNDVGLAEMHGRPVHFGLYTGSSDLIGILKPHGRFVAFEVKSKNGKCTEAQQNFIHLVRTYGGVAEVVRSVGEFVDLIGRARRHSSPQLGGRPCHRT